MRENVKDKEGYYEVRVEFKEGVDPVVAKVTAENIKEVVRDNIHVEDVYLCELTGHVVPAGDYDED